MKKLAFAAIIAAAFGSANAQVTLYNGLGGSQDDGYWDVDGGINNAGANRGGAVGQLITDVAGASTISNIEAYYVGFDGSSAATGLWVEVFDFTTNTLVGTEAISTFSETDSTFTSSNLAGYDKYDIDAAVNIGGLVAGDQYIVSMQVQSPDINYLGVSYTGNLDTYVKDNSEFGYSSEYGLPNWTEANAGAGLTSSDTMMNIEAIPSTPEPISMGVLGVGLVAMLRRRCRA